MESDEIPEGQRFEVFGSFLPESLQGTLYTVFMGYLKGEIDVCIQEWHEELLVDFDKVRRYLDDPIGADENEVLQIVPKERFLLMIIKLAMGYFASLKNELTHDYNKIVDDLRILVDVGLKGRGNDGSN